MKLSKVTVLAAAIVGVFAVVSPVDALRHLSSGTRPTYAYFTQLASSSQRSHRCICCCKLLSTGRLSQIQGFEKRLDIISHRRTSSQIQSPLSSFQYLVPRCL